MNSSNIKKSSLLLFRYLKISGVVSVLLFISFNSDAQRKDTIVVEQTKDYKNIIKINLTSFILYSDGLQLNYERVLSRKRSFTIFGGIIQFPVPSSIANSSMIFDTNKKKSGFTIGSEYRFYLAKENKYDAPHGIYLAPFISYYHFNNQRFGKDTLNPSASLFLNTSVDFFNVGVELGYQFVIKNRFVIDCVMFGPALTSYYFNVKLDGNAGNYDENIQAILEAMKNKYPLLKDLSSDNGISKSGISNFWSLGFRYAIQIGYRF